MRSDEPQKELSPAAERLVDLACEELGEMSARARSQGFLELDTRRRAGKQRARRAVTVPLVLAVAAIALGVGHWVGTRQGRALSYAVEGGRIDPTGVVETSGKVEPTLRFSDGTEIVFLAGASGRVKSVGKHDARVLLRGKARVRVVPRRGSHWLFDAGPFLITVTGTAFTAEWRDADERLEIALDTGSISVTGPLSDEAIVVRAGQRLTISVREKEVRIRGIDSVADASVTSTADSPRPERTLHAPGPPPLSPTPAATSAPSAPRAAASDWRAELAAGRFVTIVRQAEERGLDTTIAGVSSDELAALADAARYSRRDDVARRALTAQRRRFPGSARANDAAFLLGRLEETARHPELALGWYERYLGESPNGTYASEALGRKMTMVQRLHGAARARPVAEEYLRRFGNGTYAAAARTLTEAP